MKRGEKLSLEQMRALLEASQEVCFTGHNRGNIYDWAGKQRDCRGATWAK